MLFIDVLNKFTVLSTINNTEVCIVEDSIDEDATDFEFYVNYNGIHDDVLFASDAAIRVSTFHPVFFSVTAVNGYDYTFRAFTPVNLNEVK